jgi:hypothetical protein
MNDTLQVVVTVLGIVSQLLLLGRHFKDQDTSVATSTDQRVGLVDPPRIRLRNRLDLSFVLICAAFFSLLLTDSLLISGKNPSPGLSTILTVLVITSVIVTIMVAAWWMNLTELVTGCLAVTTLFVLIIANGGPFFAATTDTIAGLSLLLPILSLITITSATLIYALGNPLSRIIKKKRRTAVTLTLLSLVIVSAAALGKQLALTVKNDSRTPKIISSEAKLLAQSVMRQSLAERRKFYKLASEVSLGSVYQKYFRTVRQNQGYTLESSSPPAPTPEQPSARTTAASKPGPRETASPIPSNMSPPRPTTTPSDNSSGNAEVQRRKILRDMINDAFNRGESEIARSLQEAYYRSGNAPDILKEQGVERTGLLLQYFDSSDVNSRQKYIRERLNWIHPAGLEQQTQATIYLPGTTAEERFNTTSQFRVFTVLYDQPNLRQKILKEFEYPEDVRQFFRERDDKLDTRLGLLEGLQSPVESKLYKPSLFPKIESNVNNSQLQTQLSLPKSEEAYVAYQEYKSLASLLIKQNFKGRVDETKIDELSTTFNSLDDLTQDAFLNYVINNKNIPADKVYQMLLDFEPLAHDFSAFATSQDPFVTEKLASMFEGKRFENSDIQTLYDKVYGIQSKDAKEVLLRLLKNESPDLPVKKIFQSQVFSLIAQINQHLGSEKNDFFNAVADPVWLVLNNIAQTESGKANATDSAKNIETNLDAFRRLQNEDQAGLLQQLAITFYQPGGPYSLDPVRLLIAQAQSWNDGAAFVCASFISLPLLLMFVLLGGFFSRKLVARDRMRELINEETSSFPADSSTLGTPVELFGRDETLRNLRSLAERGWSTIGVVGRRGVGKSRLLFSLFKDTFSESTTPTIRVWVSSPSKFQEEDFIYSMFERLALSTEGTIAGYLNAKPLSVRRMESRAAQVGAWSYTAALVILGFLVLQMYDRLTRADIILTWLPILVIVCTSLWIMVDYLSKRQPVDLSPWLQRDRAHNPHTVMLYKEVYDVLRALRSRQNISPARFLGAKGVLRFSALLVLAMIFVGSAGFIFLNFRRFGLNELIFAALVLLVLSAWGWVSVYQHDGSQEQRLMIHGQSLMSLIADYRSFATTIVYRLGQGALGHKPERKFSVLICVDELDKVVDFEEIRAFVRRIKAIFEVPGVYYYVSLAEDTLTSLYLGPAAGKNEIDSAFDHIIRIPQLPCSVGEIIASKYLESHGITSPRPKLTRVISTLSFGVARDIIRRCDEFIARENRDTFEAIDLVDSLRRMHLRMGYELHQLLKSQVTQLTNVRATRAAAAAQAVFNNGTQSESDQRLVLLIWLISLVEAATELLDKKLWLQITEELCALGYRLSIDSVVDLVSEIEDLHMQVLALTRKSDESVPAIAL